ncbi:MAG TPA: ATPase, T2SS/T4P/T4SS family, partial [Motiliproteus sp.]
PVEYRLERINQVGINPKIGLDFATVLRACLRQDPDILLVGEIRDHETATIALRAAMTGHLVLSTLHTNDAISSAMRLVDIGVEGFVAASALRGVLAQRLVRRVCVHCAHPYTPTRPEQAWLSARIGAELGNATFRKGMGCTYCNNTGYSGRIGIFELLELDDNMADALRLSDTSAFTRAARASAGFRTLAESALSYAQQGLTTLDEVFRVTEQMDEISAANEADRQTPAVESSAVTAASPEVGSEPDVSVLTPRVGSSETGSAGFSSGGLSLEPIDGEE